MKLFYSPKTRALRPRWLMEEMGLSYDMVNIDLSKGEHKTADFLKINPMGAIPAFEDENGPIFESAAIVAYLADKFPEKNMAPKPNSPDRSKYMQWMFFAAATLDNPVVTYFYHTQLLPADKRNAKTVEDCVAAFQKAAKVLDAHLKNRTYMVGNEFSAVDVLTTSLLAFAKNLKLMDEFPGLLEYTKRGTQRDAFKRAIA